MRKIKKILALLLSITMVLGLGVAAWAAPVAQAHEITISNTDQNVAHTYEVYQIFKGNLNAAEDKLSDIEWGSSITNSAGLIEALKASDELKADTAYVSSTTNKKAGEDRKSVV